MSEANSHAENMNETRSEGATAAQTADDGHSHNGWKLWRDRILLVAIIWAVWALITTFVVQPFRIPSASMENTLQIGDRIIVSKFTPRFSNVHRGDVVVFKDPGDWTDSANNQNGILKAIRKVAEVTHLSASGNHLVKRVVGVGGDHVSCAPGGKLTVNGVAITEPYLKSGQVPCLDKFDIHVPKNKVWVMGDNRGDSADSRFHDDGTGALGSVPVSDITGKAVAIVWPVTHWGGGGSDNGAFSKVPAGS